MSDSWPMTDRVASRHDGISQLCTPKLRKCGRLPSFTHSTHLHEAEQAMPAWKHSQYFLRQFERLQLQPRA